MGSLLKVLALFLVMINVSLALMVWGVNLLLG